VIAVPDHFAKATHLYRERQLPEAEAICRKILKAEPQNAEVLHLIGKIASEAQHYGVAIAFIQKAIALDKERASFHASLARVYRFLWRMDEAVESAHRALAIDPACADAHYELGSALYQQGDVWGAIEHCRCAIELNPEHGKAHERLGTAHLLLAENWWHAHSAVRPHGLGRREWCGEPLNGDPILLRTDQGFGDTLQWVRYAPLLTARGGRVTLEVHSELLRLMSTLPNVENVIARGAPLPEFAWHCRLRNLPLALRPDLNNLSEALNHYFERFESLLAYRPELAVIPGQVPYLAAAPELARTWAIRLGERSPRIGLNWAGLPTQHMDPVRSLRHLSLLAPLGEIEGATFFSIQKGSAAAQARNPPAGMQLVDLSPHLKDFADTAAVIAGLDLVISSDTAVVHLAGALGKPVWILLPYVADWIWLSNRDDTPWYPTARLFRQPARGAWSPVIERVAGELRRLVAGDRSVLSPADCKGPA
jgi:tetratricopeptide (TPR) repeat protein